MWAISTDCGQRQAALLASQAATALQHKNGCTIEREREEEEGGRNSLRPYSQQRESAGEREYQTMHLLGQSGLYKTKLLSCLL